MNKDGQILNDDSLEILRIAQGVRNSNSENKCSNNICHTIKNGSNITLKMAFDDITFEPNKLITYGDTNNYYSPNDDIIIDWQVISNVDNIVTCTKDSAGSAQIHVSDTAPEGTIVAIKGTITENYKDGQGNDVQEVYEDVIYWKIIAESNTYVKADAITSGVGEEFNIETESNVENINSTYTAINDNIQIITENNVSKCVAKNPGPSAIIVESDGKTKQIDINVVKPVESIQTDKTKVTVRQGQKEEIQVTVNPQNATENIEFESADTNIAIVGYDKYENRYTVQGVNDGTTTVTFFSPSNKNIKSTVTVQVVKQDTPKISNIEVENADKNKVLVKDDEFYIKVNFDSEIIGEEPKLSIKFGDYNSIGDAEFVEKQNNGKTLKYKYKIQEGDNGVLQIERLIGGSLTDNTNTIQAITSMENDVINNLNAENNTDNFINNSIYKTIEDVVADTSSPEIKIQAMVDKDSNWLKEGDEIKVKIIPKEELKNAPTVIFDEVAANVEEIQEDGKNSYIASLPVTGLMDEGYLSICVENIVDKAGNNLEEFYAEEEGIDEPIIIDNAKPMVESVTIFKEEGKDIKEGDNIKIVVGFGDLEGITNEYVSAKEVPTLNVKVGGNEAKGTITSDYEPGKYANKITYTYTVAKGETGEITVNKVNGEVTDAAGNTANLSDVSWVSGYKEENKTDDNDNSNNGTNGDNSNKGTNNNNSDNGAKDGVNNNARNKNQENGNKEPKLIGEINEIVKSPKTGDNILIYIGITVFITGIVFLIVEFNYRKNKK